jgi:hypothetical protein
VLAGGTAMFVVGVSSCGRGCREEPVERAPAMVVLEASSLELPAIDPLKVGASNGKEVALASTEDQPAAEQPITPKPIPPATETDDLGIVDGHSAIPTSKEWMAAKPLHTTHPHCRARVIREWVTIHCTTDDLSPRSPIGAIRVLAGDATEVQQWIFAGQHVEGTAFLPMTAAVIFPVRRGDRRLLEIAFVAQGAHQRFDRYDAYTVSAAWLEGMKTPDVTVAE